MPTMQAVIAITPEKKEQLDALCDQYEMLPGYGSARATKTIWDWYCMSPDIMADARYSVYMPVLSTCEVLEIDIDTSFPNVA